jgi:hypothetical protein
METLRIWLAVVLVVSAGVVLASGVARAENPHLARARVELDQLRFDEARSSLATALRSGGSTPDEIAEIYRLSGQVAAALGDVAEAENSFRRFLALSPGATLPAGTSPKITAPFSAAQAKMQGSPPLAVRLEGEPGWPLVVRVVVESDPMSMIAGAEIEWWVEGEEPRRATESGDGPIDVPIPLAEQPGARILVRGTAIDRFGNHLREVGRDEPIVVWQPSGRPPVEEPPVETTRSRPFYARSYTWAAVTIGFLGIGTYYAFKVRSTQDELDDIEANPLEHDYSEWVDVKERGEREALIANITFGAAGAFAIVTTILLVRDLTSSDGEPAVRAEPVAWPGGAGLFVTGRF